MFDSASVNSISSTPSWVYQCKKRLALNIAVNWSLTRQKRDGHLEPARGNVALVRKHVVRDPLDKVARVFVLHVLHLFLDFLHRHSAAEHGGDGEVAAVPRVRGSHHHVLGVKHLLRQFGHGDGAVLLTAASGEGRETGHEKVLTREGDHVDGEFAEIRLELTGETQSRW